MDLLSLHSPSLTALPSSRTALMEKSSFLSGQILTIAKNKRHPDARNLKFLDFRARTSGYAQGTSKSNLGTKNAIRREMQSKDDDLAFVAGATGKVGSRTVRELLKLGFRVRAGVRSPQKAEPLVQSVRQMKLDDAAVEKLEIVECDLERDAIEPAIGNASIVICCIGASEKEIFDVTGPYRIDYLATKKLIDAATSAKVKHFILLTSLGTNKIGFPASILNLFWGVLIWKRKAEEALLASSLPYTIVRPGGMERPTDAYKETHNLVLANEDIYFGGQVSNLQVAELMAFMAKNRSLSFCKVIEVIAETTAPLTPMGELLAKIPSQRVDSSLKKELQTDSKPDPAPSQSIETKSTAVEKEPIQTEVPKTRPLSPYIVYDDLKPPTSPTPTPSTTPGGPKESHLNVISVESEPIPANTQISVSEPTAGSIEKELAKVNVPKPRPSSPFVAYEDLKPPTSPTPTPSSTSGAKEKLVINAPPDGSVTTPNAGDGVAGKTPVVEKEVLQVSSQNSYHLSPYYMYEEMKPPTSPSPTTPYVSTISTSPKESNSQKPPVANASISEVPPSDKLGDKQHFNQQKLRYEDLKPPTSPIPSSKKF